MNVLLYQQDHENEVFAESSYSASATSQYSGDEGERSERTGTPRSQSQAQLEHHQSLCQDFKLKPDERIGLAHFRSIQNENKTIRNQVESNDMGHRRVDTFQPCLNVHQMINEGSMDNNSHQKVVYEEQNHVPEPPQAYEEPAQKQAPLQIAQNEQSLQKLTFSNDQIPAPVINNLTAHSQFNAVPEKIRGVSSRTDNEPSHRTAPDHSPAPNSASLVQSHLRSNLESLLNIS